MTVIELIQAYEHKLYKYNKQLDVFVESKLYSNASRTQAQIEIIKELIENLKEIK
jgi:hypothetical protein